MYVYEYAFIYIYTPYLYYLKLAKLKLMTGRQSFPYKTWSNLAGVNSLFTVFFIFDPIHGTGIFTHLKTTQKSTILLGKYNTPMDPVAIYIEIPAYRYISLYINMYTINITIEDQIRISFQTKAWTLSDPRIVHRRPSNGSRPSNLDGVQRIHHAL